MREWWPWCVYIIIYYIIIHTHTHTHLTYRQKCVTVVHVGCQGMATRVAILLWVQTQLFSATLVTSGDCLWESIESHIL